MKCINIGICIWIINLESGVITNKWYQSRLSAITPAAFLRPPSCHSACHSIARLLHQSANRVACIVCFIIEFVCCVFVEETLIPSRCKFMLRAVIYAAKYALSILAVSLCCKICYKFMLRVDLETTICSCWILHWISLEYWRLVRRADNHIVCLYCDFKDWSCRDFMSVIRWSFKLLNDCVGNNTRGDYLPVIFSLCL